MKQTLNSLSIVRRQRFNAARKTARAIADSYFRAVGESLLQASPFDVDLIPLEHAGERMNEQVKEGEVLYDEK